MIKNNIPQTQKDSESESAVQSLGTKNPINSVEVKHRKAKKLPVFVSAEDLTKLLKVSKHKHHKYAYMMGWYSGMRISEILNLEPRDVDMAKGTVFVRQGKGSKDRVTRLCPFFRVEMFELMPLKKLLKARALQKAFKKDCGIMPFVNDKATKETNRNATLICGDSVMCMAWYLEAIDDEKNTSSTNNEKGCGKIVGYERCGYIFGNSNSFFYCDDCRKLNKSEVNSPQELKDNLILNVAPEDTHSTNKGLMDKDYTKENNKGWDRITTNKVGGEKND